MIESVILMMSIMQTSDDGSIEEGKNNPFFASFDKEIQLH